MSKKLINISIFCAIILFCVGFVFGVDYSISSTTSSVTISDNYYHGNIIKGGEDVTLNFTIIADTTLDGDNITMVNITFVGVNFTITEANLQNNSLVGTDAQTLNAWDSWNETWDSVTSMVFNDSQADAWDATGAAGIDSTTNTTLYAWFNITATSPGNEGQSTIRVGASNYSAETSAVSVASEIDLTVNIDDRLPTWSELNITNGNWTLMNLSDSRNINATYIFDNDSDLTVSVTISELNVESGSVILYYMNNDSVMDYTVEDHNSGQVTMTTSGSAPDAVYTADIPSSSFVEGNITNFMVMVNDSVDHLQTINRSNSDIADVDVSLNFTVNGTYTAKIINFNITDGTNTVTQSDLISGEGYLKANEEYILEVEITGENRLDEINFYYNQSGAGATQNSTLLSLKNKSITTVDPSLSVVYNASIAKGMFNHTNVTDFLVLVNQTVDSTDAESLTIYQAIFNSPNGITFDGATDVPTITMPSSTSITTSRSITITCSGAESTGAGIGSGTASNQITITKPGGTTVTGQNTATFTGTNTNEVGTYTVGCLTTDNVGNTASASNSFTVSHSTGSTDDGGSSPLIMKGGSPTTPTFNIDFSEGATEGTLTSVREGNRKTLSFDGITQHTFTLDELTEDSATFTFASTTPVTVSLTVGETKELDINSDGTNDLSVTLDKIAIGKADFTVKKLAGADTLEQELAEEVETAECGNGVCEAGENYANCIADCPASTSDEAEEAPSLTWLWILLVIIVVAIIIYFVATKKQKK